MEELEGVKVSMSKMKMVGLKNYPLTYMIARIMDVATTTMMMENW